MKIFINPGHGDFDGGACGNGLIERDVALDIARRTANYLRAVNYDTKICQRNDLEFICNTCNDWQADLFVSIHTRLVDTLPLVDRGIKQRGFYVLTATDCPAVLVETSAAVRE